MAASAPGVDGQTQTPFCCAGALPARMPVLLPADQVSGNHQLVAVGIGAMVSVFGWRSERDVLQHQLQRVHAEFGGTILNGGHSDEASLRMIGRAPRSCWANISGDGRMLLALVGNVYNVRHGWGAAASRTAGAPGFRLP